jgi:hypothetical protein
MSNPNSDIREGYTPTQSPYPLSVPAESPIGIDISKPQLYSGSNSSDGFTYKRKSSEEHGGCEKRRQGVHLQLFSDVQNADIKLFLDATNRVKVIITSAFSGFQETIRIFNVKIDTKPQLQDLDNEKIGDGAVEKGRGKGIWRSKAPKTSHEAWRGVKIKICKQ